MCEEKKWKTERVHSFKSAVTVCLAHLGVEKQHVDALTYSHLVLRASMLANSCLFTYLEDAEQCLICVSGPLPIVSPIFTLPLAPFCSTCS